MQNSGFEDIAGASPSVVRIPAQSVINGCPLAYCACKVLCGCPGDAVFGIESNQCIGQYQKTFCLAMWIRIEENGRRIYRKGAL